MRKRIYVKSVIKQDSNYNLVYVRVHLFVIRLIEAGISVKCVKALSPHVSADTSWHKIVLSYKRKDKKEFDKKYNSVLLDDYITTWFNIVDKISNGW